MRQGKKMLQQNSFKEGKIVKINKDLYTVLSEESVLSCYVRGKLKNDKLTVGDNVSVDLNSLTIEKQLPRKNSLVRPLVSNIDSLFIVVSTEVPAFSEYLLDKMLSLAIYNKIKPIIIVTKLDKIKRNERNNILKVLKYYKKYFSVYKNTEIRKIVREINGKTVALCGQTGAGKSTLLNRIDKNLKLSTDEVSYTLGRGKHTTRLVELIKVKGGFIADTPGFSSLDLDISKDELKYTFPDFMVQCKYKSCNHIKEDGCKVIERVKTNKILYSRYENYLKLLKETRL